MPVPLLELSEPEFELQAPHLLRLHLRAIILLRREPPEDLRRAWRRRDFALFACARVRADLGSADADETAHFIAVVSLDEMTEGPAVDGDADGRYAFSFSDASRTTVVRQVIVLVVAAAGLHGVSVRLENVLRQDLLLLDVPVIILDKAAPFESTMHAREADPSLRVRPRLGCIVRVGW